MSKTVGVLSGLLALQLALALALHLGSGEHAAFVADRPLLTFEREAVDGIHIEGPESNVTLQKQGNHWRLPELDGFPAEDDRVDDLLSKLAGLQQSWPVATSGSAAQRFKLAVDDFERHILLKKDGDILAELFVGTSPGFRKVHLRVAGEDAVQTAVFSAFDAGAKADDWLDKTLMSRPAAQIRRLEMADFTLLRGEQGILLQGLADDEELDAAEADKLLERVARLRISGVLGRELQPGFNREASQLTYTLELDSGARQTYVFSVPEQGADAILKASHRDEFFKVENWTLERLKEIGRDKLVKKVVSATGAANGESAGPSAEPTTPLDAN